MRFIRYHFICWLFLFACMQVHAQEQTRGFGTVTPPAAATKAGRTVALVVGVSDYPFVTPLNYAAEDALLMYDFLQSNAGGNVSPADIRLLVNEEATLQNVWGRGLSWIENTVKPAQGDRVIIYLAGHGDAIDADESFFLCHNVNPAGDKNNYFVSGALNIRALKKRIAKFSAAGAEVVLIMDACRSGDLPGARTGITNPFESVVEIKAGETLMLSAGANQLAVEDRRWGRGHGIFTWYLVQGLSGKADENADGTVDFYELEQYTKTKVRKETQSMGRNQVPQFAASPSGMRWQGKADRTFLTKLETESLSSVNVGESIALARSTAESSWFTDSTLYAGFNELKKLVRAGKYLGEGSAEPMYTQLTAQFSADQLEPVRVYYMSALAGAGFEAINYQIRLELGYTAQSTYYSERFGYLLKARSLQMFENEVDQLEDYQELLEAINYFYESYQSGNELQLPLSLVESLSKMQVRFPRCAAYYFVMANVGINPVECKQYQFNSIEYNSLMNNLLDSVINFAPNWPKIELIRLKNNIELSEDKISELIKRDSLSDSYRFLELLYLASNKPINPMNWRQSLVKWANLKPNSYCVSMLLLYLNSGNKKIKYKDLQYWFMSEAIENNYRYFESDDSLLINLEYFRRFLIDYKDNDFYAFNIQLIIEQLVELLSSKFQLLNFAEPLAKTSEFSLKRLNMKDLAVISMVLEVIPGYESESEIVDSILYERLKLEEYIFSDSTANFLAYRIRQSVFIEELAEFRDKQMDLLIEFSYPGFKDELTFFRADYIVLSKSECKIEGFADSLFSCCRRFPDKKNYELYFNFITNYGLNGRCSSLYNDSIFRYNIFRENIGRSLYYRVESYYYCLTNDVQELRRLLLGRLSEKDTTSFMSVMLNLEPAWKQIILAELSSYDSLNIGFLNLVDLGLFDQAEKAYKSLLLERDDQTFLLSEGELNNGLIQREIAAVKMFNGKGDFYKSAEILEKLIGCYSLNGYGPLLFLPIDDLLGPYDAFIQSKEYKAMMARVYTSPEK